MAAITAPNYFSGTDTPGLAPTGYASVPIYDTTGRITGYKKVQYGTGPTAQGAPSAGTYNPGGLLPKAVDVASGQPTTAYSNPTVNGSAGPGIVAAGTSTPAGSGQPQFNLLQTTKNPTIQADVNAATAATGQNIASENQNFQSYLTAAQEAQKQQTADVKADTSALAALPGQLNTSLTNTNTTAAKALNDANTNYQNLNTQNAATVAGDVSQLGTLDAAEAQAQQNAVNLGVSQANGEINRRSINPSGSSGDSSEYNQAVLGTDTQAQIALQNQLSQQQIQQLTNYVTPLQQSLYSENVAQNQFAAQIAQSIAGMQTGSAEQVAALTQAVTGRSAQEAQSLLTSLGIPLQVQQQVMSSIGNSTGALTSADNANNFYGLSTTYNGTPVVLPSYQQPAATPVTGGGGSPYARPGALPNGGNVSSGTQPMGAASVTAAATPIPGANGNPGSYANPALTTPGAWNGTSYNPQTIQYNVPGLGVTNSTIPANLTPQQRMMYLATGNPYADPSVGAGVPYQQDQPVTSITAPPQYIDSGNGDW